MHHQVIADKVEPVAVQARGGGTIQSFSELAIKNQKAQPLAFDNVFQTLRHPHAETVGFSKWILAVVKQDGGS
jgi:hypothetical protein